MRRSDQTLLSLFAFLVLIICRFAVEPYPHKCNPTGYSNPDPRNPNPACADLPASRPLIVGEVSHRHFPLDIDVGQIGSFVIDPEGEDAMLVGNSEGG